MRLENNRAEKAGAGLERPIPYAPGTEALPKMLATLCLNLGARNLSSVTTVVFIQHRYFILQNKDIFLYGSCRYFRRKKDESKQASSLLFHSKAE